MAPRFLVQADFHNGVDSVAALVSADDRDSAESVLFAAFQQHADWEIESATVVREADKVDESRFLDVASFC